MPEEEIKIALLQGRRLLLWIGAGISVSAGIPTDSAVNGLAYRLARIHYGGAQQVAQELGTNFRLADLAARVGKPRIRDLIRQLAWPDLQPTTAHRAIAALIAEGFHIDLATTNFDPLMEKALGEPGIDVNFKVVSSAGTVRALSNDVLALVKVHGCPYTNDDPNDLVILEADLRTPPGWVIAFLNGRLQERAFVYVGFSGDAPYVQRSIEQTLVNLHGGMNEGFAIDIVPPENVFGGGNELGEFYGECHVTPQNYSAAGSDAFFSRLADLVLRAMMLEALSRAAVEARRHVAADEATLQTDIREMSFAAIRSFARRLGFLLEKPTRVSGVCLTRALEWMLVLCACRVLEDASFRPALVSPFYPGPSSTAAGPVVLLDGGGQIAEVCRSDVGKRYDEGDVQAEFAVRGCARWYAIILNCRGTLHEGSLNIVPSGEDSMVGGYNPMLCLDENSLLDDITRIREVFQ